MVLRIRSIATPVARYITCTCSKLPATFALFPVLSLQVYPRTIKASLYPLLSTFPVTKIPGSLNFHNFNVFVLERGSLGTRLPVICRNKGCIPSGKLPYSAQKQFHTQNHIRLNFTEERVWFKVTRTMQTGKLILLNHTICIPSGHQP